MQRPADVHMNDEPAHTRSLERTVSAGSGLPLLASFGLDPPNSHPSSPSHASATARQPAVGFHQDVMKSLLDDHPLMEEPYVDPVEVNWWKRLLAFTGPGWLMSIAYVDPGNLEADLQCGAQFGYTLLWVLLSATGIGLGMQLVAARLGCATRRHLAEHCREQYGMGVRILLWLLTELAIIGSDIQEVIGCSIGLQLLFGLPLSAGVLVTAAAAFGFLFLERFGTRPLELFFGILIVILGLSMGGLFAEIKPDRHAVLEGLVIPRLPANAMSQAVGMVGCIIMPHNLFLHSALVQSRVIEKGEERDAIQLFTIESTAAILTSVLINAAVVSIFAKGFYGGPHAEDIGLKNAGAYLGRQYGDVMRIIWGMGLVAAGQSSTMTGAYAGQWVMQGYLKLKVKPWKRAIITRSMALVPTLAVAIYFGGGQHEGLDSLNSYLNILQSLVLPFAVVPLLTFASDRRIMGDLALVPCAQVLCWLATALVMAANLYLFIEQFGEGGVGVGLVLGISVYTFGVLYVAMSQQGPKDGKP